MCHYGRIIPIGHHTWSISMSHMLELRQGERTKFDRFVDPNVRGAQYIQIYESIVIEFFLRLKIHIICADVPRFDIDNFNFIVSMAKPYSFIVKTVYCTPPDQYKITVDS